MATTREIQQRIHSIKGTQQITRAMKLVATAKLQKVRAAAEENKPYFRLVYDTVTDIMRLSRAEGGPLMPGFEPAEPAEDAPDAYLLLTSDRGLAGGYNVNVCRLLEQSVSDKARAVVLTIGRRGREYLAHRGYTMGENFTLSGEALSYRETEAMAGTLLSLYTEGKVKSVQVIYTTFRNTLSQEPTRLQLLPLQTGDAAEAEDAAPLMEYEPDKETVMRRIVPQYLTGILYGAVIESQASEQGARMTAMDAATDNAEEIIGRLTLQYNRARQGRITQELTEIINGAAALE